MREEEWRKIRSSYGRLIAELDLKNGAPSVIDILYSQGVLLQHDKNRLQEKPVAEDKNRLLLEILHTKDDDAYRIFVEAVQTTQPHVSERLQPPRPPKGRPGVKPASASHLAAQEQIGNFSTTELQKWIQQILEQQAIPEDMIRSTVEIVENEMIDGSVFVDMTESEFGNLFTTLRFGPMKKLIKARDHLVKGEHSDRLQERQSAYEKKPELQRTEYVRDFGHDLTIFENYHKGRILNKHEERAGNLINPVRQFFPCISESADTCVYQYIADKVTVFAAACLNDRTNGTIYFGIGDIRCEQFAYGEVLGITLDKKECEDAIRLSLTRRFSEEVKETAERCIRPPFFIPVIDAAGDRGLIVCEVDIEPRSEWVKELAFFVSPLSETTENSSNIDPELHRFSAGIPKKQDAKQIEKFSGEKVLLTKDREQQEKSLTSSRNQNLVETLKDYMCGGGDTLEGNFYPILATPSISVSQPDFPQTFQFIFHVDWRCILDFDPKSDENGLYCYADNEKKQVYNLKRPDSFLPSFPDKHPTKSSFEDQLQDFMESPQRQWIFCNGYATERDEGFQVHQWKQKRSEGYRETVRWLKQSIPEGRAVIFILVTSHDDVFIEASEDLILKFETQWLMVSQSRRLAEAWIDGLRQRNVIVDKDRCICGFSFSEVNKAIIQLLGCQVLDEGQCVVTTTSGVQEMLTVRQMQQDLCDLDVVSADQCCSAKPQNKEEILKLSAETEKNFYKGNTATWWNFYFQGHVCKRDRYDHLLTYTRETLKGENASDNDVIGRVAIYHQPGAGGTTVALNVLWDLKSEYKCCQIRRITEETARQIFTLYEVGEGHREHKKPVLVMFDNEDDDKISILTKKITEECDVRKISEIVCVFLLCTRRMSLPQEYEKKKIILLHKLSQRECQFFLDKYKKLMEQYSCNKGRVNPDSLLGLNIMKENFSEDYIKRTVKTLLEVFQNRQEKTVLKYLALLNKYDSSFRGIPVTCFDPLMVRGSSKAWEGCMPVQPLLTFTYNKQLSGRTNCLRISCQLLCSYILDISLDEDKSHGDLMEELICSPVIQRHDCNVAYQQLLCVVKEIMTKRYWTDDQMRSTFSPFIQNLYDEKEYELAAKCMELVFQRIGDAVLAQQLARFYIWCKNWNSAEMWAEEAVKRWPQNSFILDTKGQVSKFRLLELLNECEANQGSINPERVMEAVQYAHQGCVHFKQEQGLRSNDSPNMAGYFGQMDIILYLIKILKCSSIFHSTLELQRFFSDETFIPEELRKSEKNIQWLKSLQDQAFQSLRFVEDSLKLSSVSEQESSTQAIFLNERTLDHYRSRLNRLFSEEGLLTKDPQNMNPEQRRRVVRKLGGYSLFSIMKTYREQDGRARVSHIKELMSLNLENSSRNRFDLSMALASALCLYSDPDNLATQNPYLRNVLKWSQELYKMKQDEYIDLDPFLYFLVFHWPTPKRGFLCPPSELHKIMNRADEAFRKKQQQNPGYQKSSSSLLFFLTNQPLDNSIVSQDKLAAWAGSDCRRIHRVKRLLKSPQAVNLLERFSGVLDSTGWKVKVTLESQEGNKMDVDIPLFTRENRQILKMKRVYFVLGFGYHGPVACDVDSSRPFPAQGSQPLGVVHHQLPRYLYPPPLPNYDQKIEEILHEIRQARLALSENGPPQKREQLSQTIRNLETELQKYQILRRSATLHNSM